MEAGAGKEGGLKIAGPKIAGLAGWKVTPRLLENPA
jgi:hypothetical protein